MRSDWRHASRYANIVQIFRDDDGKPCATPGSGLMIELKDFASGDLSRDVQGFLQIDSVTLYRMLEPAERGMGSGSERRALAQQ